VVTLAPNFRSPEAVKRWAERVRAIAGVAKVDYNQEWIDALAGLIRYIELAAIGVGVILSAAAVTIIGNTIRLALLSRREEIEILQLIGATRAFIRVPYLLEGAVLGICGSALSLGILKIGFELFRQQVRTAGRFSGFDDLMSFFPLSMCLALVMVGMGLGFAGSFVSLRRFGEGRA
jgi:cell division transport system permease protein